MIAVTIMDGIHKAVGTVAPFAELAVSDAYYCCFNTRTPMFFVAEEQMTNGKSNPGAGTSANQDGLEPKEFYSTAEAAKILGVSHRTVQLWVENGALQAWKTAGGHRRIAAASLEKVLEERRAALAPAAAAPSAAAAAAVEPEPVKVLIVDDDATLLRLYELEMSGWDMPLQIIKASNGFDALLKIGEHHPAILISDLSMPGMDGFRMVHNLRGNPRHGDLQIIIVSGLDGSTIKSLGLPTDIPVFSKPVPFDQLRLAVEKALAA